MDLENKIQNFLAEKNDKKKIIVIYWPTWSGKTSLSIQVAKIIDSEIISTDSRQIYKYMNIWTGKITETEMENIPHHLLDVIEPDEIYSVWAFKNSSEEIIKDIYNKHKMPILCGGTGLYIDSLIFDLDIPKVLANSSLREVLENEAKEFWNEFIYQKLVDLDPEYAKELHPNNVQYVIRALEVKIITGQSKKDFRTDRKLKYDILFLTPEIESREYLYNRINTRVKMMFDEGLVEEVKSLRKIYSDETSGLQTIGYIEVVNYLKWEISLEECIALVQQHNRNYAKRQFTWFKRYKEFII